MGVKYSNKGTLLFLDDFYLEYSYSGIRKEEFYELFYDRIFKLLHDIGYKGIYDENYMIIKKRLGSIISTLMYGYLHNKMSDWNECVQIIRNYFVSIYPNKGTLKDKIKCFDYLDEFLNNCDFNIDPDTTSLIYSSIGEISDAVSFIYSKNEKAIKKGKLDGLFSSVILKTLIEVHMIENNISVLDDDNVDEYYNDVSLRDICGIYISDIKNANLYRKNELFSDEEERDLIRRAQNGDNEARDMFIYNNLRLVFRVARKYVNKGVPLLDLVQEGNMGLLAALERFDLSKNFRFSTYAYVWIKSYISKYVRCNCRNIRIPEDLYYKVQLYKDTELAFYSKNGRKPTLEEIASLMNISVNDAKRARQAREDTVSLNAVIGEDKNTELGDFISQEDTNMNELIKSFSVNRISKSPSTYDIKKLRWFNHKYINMLSDEDYLKFIRPYLKYDVSDKSEEWINRLLLIYKDHLSYGSEINEIVSIFFNDEFNISKENEEFLESDPVIKEVLLSYKNELNNLSEWNIENIAEVINIVKEKTGVKGKLLYMPVRIKISGVEHGPELPDEIYLIGKDKVIDRLS